jgi:hypothetical protein
MNLETQLKCFHDFWTSTQVTKIPQSLIQNLNYKSISKFTKSRNILPPRPNRAERTPAHTAHGRGKARVNAAQAGKAAGAAAKNAI